MLEYKSESDIYMQAGRVKKQLPSMECDRDAWELWGHNGCRHLMFVSSVSLQLIAPPLLWQAEYLSLCAVQGILATRSG